MQPNRDLLEQCQRNDRKAHHQLYGVCFSALYAVCSRYYNNRDDRMSALNMIFYRLILNMKMYLNKEKEIPFEAWIRRVAINYIIDEFRKQQRYKEIIELNDDTPDELHPITEELNQRYDQEEILRAIDSLPPISRTVFNLYSVDGFKHEEIAQMLGISSNTSKVHLFKARKKLQELLQNMQKNTFTPKTAIQ